MRTRHENRTLIDYLEIIADADGKVISSSGALFQHKRLSSKIEPGVALSVVFKGFWAPKVRQLYLLTLNRGESETIEQTLDRNGSLMTLEINARPRVENRVIVGVILTVRDITMEKRLQMQRALSQKMRTVSQLVSDIVHKMNNPIAAILNRVGGMLVDFETDPSQRLKEDLREIQEQLYNVSLVTNALTAFSMETHNDFKLIQINDVIENAINLLRFFDADKKVDYRIDLGERLPRVLGSEVTLEQCLVNVLKNAIEAAPESKAIISITSKVDEQFRDFICISIRDNGPGIAPEKLGSVVDPFYTTKGDGHNGLGLSVSYGIVSNHQGSMEISAVADGGTEVTILLPIAKIEMDN